MQKTKVYFELGNDSDEEAVRRYFSFRRQAVGAVIFTTLGVVLCLWSLQWGIGIIVFVILTFLVMPLVRRYEDRHPEREDWRP